MLNKMKVGQRLMLGSGVLCILAALLAWIGYKEIESLRRQLDAVPEMVSTRVMLADWQGNSAVDAARTVAILRSSDFTLGQQLSDEMDETAQNISAIQRRIEGLSLSEQSKASYAALNEARKEYVGAREDMLKMKRERNPDTAKVFEARFFPAMASYDLAVQSFVESLATDYIRDYEVAKEASDRAVLWLAACVAVFFASAAVLVVSMVRSITVPVKDAVRVAEALSKGDLTSRVQAHGEDEIGSLMRSLASASEQLSHLVSGIQEAAASINGGAQEISHGNNQLSQRTEAQASSLEETASSMEELTATVTHNAENASQANLLVQGASAVAARGGEVVGEVVRTMEQISQSSRRIADITGIIDGIAFQTNILALNAAVEAARAGDQGRGFAVVAAEVRSLAQRSAEAAKEIKGLIDESVTKVGIGSKLAGEAGRTMEEVVTSVHKVAEITGEIKDASREQASGIQQVNQAVTQMDHVTQQNAALVEQVSAASASLQEQALALSRAVAVFRIAAYAGHEGQEGEAHLLPEEERPLALPGASA
jgi:methyl-accepting chemotaxis protein